MQISIKSEPVGTFSLLLVTCFAVLCSSCKSALSTMIRTDLGKDSVSFVVLGDWGVNGTGHQLAVARQMDILSRQFNAQFIITTGDNFYPKGVVSTTDAQWKTSFEAVYNKEGHNIPWFPSLGNHDYGANPEAQVAYSGGNKRWKMPARYYVMEKELGESNKALFVFTDTSPFVRSYHRRSMADLQLQDTAAQLKWLQETLTSATHNWKIVVGHHPLYSSGEHGNTPELIQRFKPLLSRTGTDFYLCGHDHILEHIQLAGDPVHYLISGGGGAGNYEIDRMSSSRFARSSPGFLVMTLYPAAANFYFYNEQGKLLYHKQVVK